MKLYSFISPILERPAMYCVNNIEDLYLIVWGYLIGSEDTPSQDFMTYFRKFVNVYFKSKEDVDWPRLIRFYSSSDFHSIELFKQIFTAALEDF